VEINAIYRPNKPHPARNLLHDRPQHVTEERHPLAFVQFIRHHLDLPATHRDRCPASGPEIPHPLHIAPGRPHPSPARVLDDRDRRSAGKPAFPTPDRQKPVETHRDTEAEKKARERVESPEDPPWRHYRWRRYPLYGIAHDSIAPASTCIRGPCSAPTPLGRGATTGCDTGRRTSQTSGGRQPQVVPVRIDNPEVPQTPRPVLQRLRDGMPRRPDTLLHRVDVIDLQHDLHARAPVSRQSTLGEIPLLPR